MKQCMYQQNTSPEKGCYYENKNHSIMFMECKTANCYYKQLKRLQAENERLKKENKEINERMSDVIYRATGGRLSYSNYTLDAIEHAFQDQLAILSDRNEELLRKEYDELHIKYAVCKTANTAIQQENKELKQALEEIREDLEQDTTCESRECGCDDYGECLKCVKETILDKISEVLK